jgi:hypothetical protein
MLKVHMHLSIDDGQHDPADALALAEIMDRTQTLRNVACTEMLLAGAKAMGLINSDGSINDIALNERVSAWNLVMVAKRRESLVVARAARARKAGREPAEVPKASHTTTNAGAAAVVRTDSAGSAQAVASLPPPVAKQPGDPTLRLAHANPSSLSGEEGLAASKPIDTQPQQVAPSIDLETQAVVTSRAPAPSPVVAKTETPKRRFQVRA